MALRSAAMTLCSYALQLGPAAILPDLRSVAGYADTMYCYALLCCYYALQLRHAVATLCHYALPLRSAATLCCYALLLRSAPMLGSDARQLLHSAATMHRNYDALQLRRSAATILSGYALLLPIVVQ